MNVLLIGSFDLYLMLYTEKYVAYLKENNISFKFVYWNRSLEASPNEDFYVPFECKMNSYKNVFLKINSYFKFRKFVKNYLNTNHFDKIILVTSQTMFLFAHILKKEYKNKYIFDYRDETYERYFIYKKIIDSCISNSYKTVMSSPGFKRFFKDVPDEKFVICHNNKLSFYKTIGKSQKSGKISLSFWGNVRKGNYFKKIIKIFGNDERFQLNIYGKGYGEKLKYFCDKNSFTNINIQGRFILSDIYEFASKTDFLLNCYSNKDIQKNALTAKMYDGVFFNIPMIVQKNGYMDEYLGNLNYYHISFNFDNYTQKEGEDFKNYLASLNKNATIDKINDISPILNDIKYDDKSFYQLINDFLNNDKL